MLHAIQYVSVKRGTGRRVARLAAQCLSISMGSRAICVRRARRPAHLPRIPSQLVRLHNRRRSKQALVARAPATKGLGGAGCIPARSSRPSQPHTTVCSRRLCAILSLSSSNGRGRHSFIHSFAIGRIHSFTYSSLSTTRACTASPHSLLSNPAHRDIPTSPETPPHASARIAYTEFTSWLRHSSLGFRPCAIQTITPRSRNSIPRDRIRRCRCPGA
jgi:hypothetical protein